MAESTGDSSVAIYSLDVVSNKKAFGDCEFYGRELDFARLRTSCDYDVPHKIHLTGLQDKGVIQLVCAVLSRMLRVRNDHKLRSSESSIEPVHIQRRYPAGGLKLARESA